MRKDPRWDSYYSRLVWCYGFGHHKTGPVTGSSTFFYGLEHRDPTWVAAVSTAAALCTGFEEEKIVVGRMFQARWELHLAELKGRVA